MTIQLNRYIDPRVNVMDTTLTSILMDFVRMNPSIFFISKVGEYPQAYMDKVYKIVHAM